MHEGADRGDRRDWTDEHVARWVPVLPGLDPDIEGAVTRMQRLSVHLKRVREQYLAESDLDRQEFETLHQLVARGGVATPSELVTALGLAPASVTGRLDGLERRGFVRRTPSSADRRRVDVAVTDAGRANWRGGMDVVGREEYRLLGVLGADERAALSSMLRRVLLEAESPSGEGAGEPPVSPSSC